MSRYPAAAWKPVQNHGGAMSGNYGLVLHVQQGNNSLSGWFNNPSSSASSHFWVAKSGAVEQYVDTGTIAWAQANGNSTWCSVETEGYTNEPLTDNAINSLAALYEWGAVTHGWPNVISENPNTRGFGWHGMGGTAWGNHPSCPGDLRKNARGTILSKAFNGGPTPPTQPPTPTPQPPTQKAPPFPLPAGYYYGPASGPTQSVSGQYPPYGGPSGASGLRQWQSQMAQRGWTISADGFYGPQTQQVATQFQREKGLAADGLIGAQTWKAAWEAPVT